MSDAIIQPGPVLPVRGPIPRPPGTPETGSRPPGEPLRQELALAAARLVADTGLDYASAKRKAAQELLDGRPLPRGQLPDNLEIDEALREHLDLYDSEHAQRVWRMRRAALALMRHLAAFQPYLTGAVWKGIVADHAPIHLQLFHDDVKAVQIDLLNDGLDFEVGELPHFRDASRGEVEALRLDWQREPVVISLYRHDDLRGALGAIPPPPGSAIDLEPQINPPTHCKHKDP
jgi:hypothetical protein